MKAQNTYTITAKEESQINNILDEGLDELIGQDGMIKHNEPRYQATSPQMYNQYMYRYDHNNVDDLVNKCNNNTQRYYWNECNSKNSYNDVRIGSDRLYNNCNGNSNNNDSLSQMKNEM